MYFHRVPACFQELSAGDAEMGFFNLCHKRNQDIIDMSAIFWFPWHVSVRITLATLGLRAALDISANPRSIPRNQAGS